MLNAHKHLPKEAQYVENYVYMPLYLRQNQSVPQSHQLGTIMCLGNNKGKSTIIAPFSGFSYRQSTVIRKY